MQYKIVTSNPNKLAEFHRFGLPFPAEEGLDLREVDADPYTVILYKALDAGAGFIVEDTSLEVEGMDVGVNVRWVVSNLGSIGGKKAVWKVLLGKNNGAYITIYEGVIEGTLINEDAVGFGFDPYFVPATQKLTLSQLDKKGVKDAYSARRQAVDMLLAGAPVSVVEIASVSKWEGNYQH